MKGFFEESLNGTLRLIVKQVEGATVKGEIVTVRNSGVNTWRITLTTMFLQKVFMSGGLSQSEYLFRRVQEWARNNPNEMEVTRPEEWYV